MQALLKRASYALSVHDAETLEGLAAAVSGIDALAPQTDLAEMARGAEVLRQQVRAASSHLALVQRMEARRSGEGFSSWAL